MVDRILLCDQCRRAFAPTELGYCLRCGAVFTASEPDRSSCELCPRKPPAYDGVIPLGPYHGLLQEAVLRMKRPAGQPLCRAVSRLYLQRRGGAIGEYRPDWVLPIPMHWRRRLVRGVNSPEVLASQLGRSLRLPVATDVLVRRRPTRVQRTLRPDDRFRNVRGAFALQKGYDIRGSHVLVVDDVLTTGATCHEAAKVLKLAGAATVMAAVIAKGGGREPSRTV
ncbi:MAG TPA: ComF family protein [Planctomycetaceae bacterium]|nr:ComF family protein [Planctomycetaceae bacterium]